MRINTQYPRHLLETALDGVSVLVEHESNALDNLLAGLRERWQVAARARSLPELVRDQIDLLPDTQSRLRQDQQLRRQLLRGLRRDLLNSAQWRHA